jgi:hypothetical protein
MVLQAEQEFDLDLAKCLMIGDKESDCFTLEQLKTFVIPGKYPIKHLPPNGELSSVATILNDVKRFWR